MIVEGNFGGSWSVAIYLKFILRKSLGSWKPISSQVIERDPKVGLSHRQGGERGCKKELVEEREWGSRGGGLL